MNSLIKFPMRHRYIFDIRHLQAAMLARKLSESKSPGIRTSSSGDDPNMPMEFFGSAAEKVRVTPVPPHRPKYSPWIVHFSLASFLIYFCILREENDVDELLKRDLYDHFGEEASRLKKAFDYNRKHNLPTQEIVNRLREIGAPVPPQ